MTTSTFDGSSAGTPAPITTDTAPPPPPVEAEIRPESLLDQLRDRVDERDESEPAEWIDEIPKVGIRLVCDPDIANEDFQRWTKSAMAGGVKAGRRRRGGGNPMDMDQLRISVRALVSTNERVEMRQGKEWQPLTGRDGSPVTLESNDLLSAFGVMDSTLLLKKLYGRDARVIDAGQRLLAAAGYLDGDDLDDDDPA